MPIDHDTIRDRIKQQIEARADLTVRNVSLAIGSDSALHKFLTGANASIKLETVSNIADAIGVSLPWLLFGAEVESNEATVSEGQIAAIASRALDEIQAGMPLAEIRPAVEATLRAQLGLVLSGQLARPTRQDASSAPGAAIQAAVPTTEAAPAE